MTEPKPFASLGPTLLARKGGARPAMRPQMGPLGGPMTAMAAPALATHEPDLEDLGWNDMGEDHHEPRETPAASLTPAPRLQAVEPAEQAAPAEPEVHRQQRAIAQTISARTISAEDARPRPSEPAAPKAGRRAAFTLRLDAERHLRLRLASTVRNRSAQALVTEALDRFLAEIPGLEALTAQLQRD